MKQNWVRACEHYVLRGLSVVFSAVSAHAILWFYSSMDKVVDTSDPFQSYVKWGLAIGFTALGYFLSRGLVHRMLNREPIRVYLVLFALLELVEFSANFSQAAVAVSSVDWLHLFSGPLHQALQTMVYLVLPITPFFTIGLAVVDMDMDRAKQGYVVRGFGAVSATTQGTGAKASPAAPPVARPGGVAQALPKVAPYPTFPTSNIGPGPQASYPPMPAPAATSLSAAVQSNPLANWFQSRRAASSGPAAQPTVAMKGQAPTP